MFIIGPIFIVPLPPPITKSPSLLREDWRKMKGRSKKNFYLRISAGR